MSGNRNGQYNFPKKCPVQSGKIHTKDLLENMVMVDDSMLSEIEQGITIKGGGGYDASGRHCAFR